MWGVTVWWIWQTQLSKISIHTPRVGRDGYVSIGLERGDISIHTPRVGRDDHKYDNDLPIN